jgi:hypothetical protein
MKLGKMLGTTLAMSALLVALSACQKEEGPVEKAGKAVDNAAANVGDKVEEAGERIKDAAK